MFHGHNSSAREDNFPDSFSQFHVPTNHIIINFINHLISILLKKHTTQLNLLQAAIFQSRDNSVLHAILLVVNFQVWDTTSTF